jgi:hypothetical protein
VRQWLSALRTSMTMLHSIPGAISVEDCVYNMQIADRCGEADLADRAEEFTDSLVSPDWPAIYALTPAVLRHQRAARFRLNYALNGPDKAQRTTTSKEWERQNAIQRATLRKRYRTQEWRDMDNARRRAKRAVKCASSWPPTPELDMPCSMRGDGR